jgi:hypothetical protein
MDVVFLIGRILFALIFVVTAANMREIDPMQSANQMAHFMKNVAMLGGALVLFYVWNQLQGDAGLSITDPLFGRG